MNFLKFLNRPLSPHLTIYKGQATSTFSIWHRFTGILLLVTLLTFILIIKVSSYNLIYVNITNTHKIYLENLLFLNIIIILIYHGSNGLRHILWDMGYNLYINVINKTAIFTSFLVLTCIIFLTLKILN
uniref:Succinate:cytochrome c oxidoreductase subunit 3 n=1 Tax=Neogoniolithon spectabile TaxID=231755 RepID=A0A3G3MIK9_9FLOR|nr:succinate:cytochrome c oxidoreductase subunit 3 [Neogoniolithon spectabile]AYR06671.1 succinate:cytochrome c oxidoreductase subunit 3 [Neogoniolithon spectabile]